MTDLGLTISTTYYTPSMAESKTTQPRALWIDAVRSIACIFVIANHVVMPNMPKGTGMNIFNHYTMAGASILFFMISGALVLYKPKPAIPFLKQCLSRMVLPMVIWTLVSLLIDKFTTSLTWEAFFTKVMLIPFTPQQGIYWFIYAIFGIYLVHIYIIRHGLWPLFQKWALPTAAAIPLLVITGATASYLTVRLLSHLPKSKYIVGI